MGLVDRRGALFVLGSAALPLTAVSSEPWRSKAPSAWSAKDVERVLNDSPWARRVTIELPGGPGGSNGIGRSRNTGPGAPGGESRLLEYLVRWDSATPIREALARARKHLAPAGSVKSPMNADSSESFYILSLIPVEFNPAQRPKAPDGDAQNRIKSLTTLHRKRHEDLHPTAIAAPSEGSGILVHYFPKSDPVTLEDTDVEFRTCAAPARVGVTFPLKEMVFDNLLAL